MKRPFPEKKTIFPVIHVQDLAQAIRNTAIAQVAGCDGVFLINHEDADSFRPISAHELLDIHAAVAARFPAWWIGVNCLDLAAADVFQYLDATVSGVWVDNGEIDEREAVQLSAENIRAAQLKSGWQGLYFGGVAFKYQRPVEDAAKAAKLATDYMEVVTTSGRGTGESASVAKIQRMKQAIGAHPLAIASGISAENITQYLPWADAFLVATSISRSFYELDPSLVNQLVQTVRAWESRH